MASADHPVGDPRGGSRSLVDDRPPGPRRAPGPQRPHVERRSPAAGSSSARIRFQHADHDDPAGHRRRSTARSSRRASPPQQQHHADHQRDGGPCEPAGSTSSSSRPGRLDPERCQPADESEHDGRRRHAASPSNDGVRELVGDEPEDEEQEGDGEAPISHWTMGLRSGAPIVACWAPITVISAINSVQASETRISIPKIRKSDRHADADHSRPPPMSAADAAGSSPTGRPGGTAA